MKCDLKKCLVIVLLICLIALNSNLLFAAVMTDTELDSILDNFKTKYKEEIKEQNKNDTSEPAVNITRNTNDISITVDSDVSNFKYDFSSDYEFYVDTLFKKSMSFEEAAEEHGKSILPALGFSILASNKGQKVTDSIIYYTFDLLSVTSSGKTFTKADVPNGYVYAQKILESNTTLDRELYTFNVTKLSETSDEIILRNKITVKYNKDFSVIKNFVDSLDSNSNNSSSTSTKDPTSGTKNNIQASAEWPKAGFDILTVKILYVTAGVAIVGIIGVILLKKKIKLDCRKEVLNCCIILLICYISVSSAMIYRISKNKEADEILYSSVMSEYSSFISENNSQSEGEEKENNENLIQKESDVIGIIKINKINLELPILSHYTEELMKIAPTKYCGTSPNFIGNMVIIGHNNYDNTQFSNLNRLKIGDEVVIIDSSKHECHYEVYDRKIVKSNDFSIIEEDGSILKSFVTLVTCINGTKNRLIVKCVEKD